MDFHAAMETFAEAWVAANTQTAVNSAAPQTSRASTLEQLPTMVSKEQLPETHSADCNPPGGASSQISPEKPMGMMNFSKTKSIPIHCVVETFSGSHSDNGVSGVEPTIELDTYAILPSTTLFSEIVRTALVKLGYTAAEAMGAKGAIQIKNWKPLTFDTVTENPDSTVEDILGDLTSMATLRIRLGSRSKHMALEEVKEKLLNFLLQHSQSVLMTSGCPIEKTTLSQITKGDYLTLAEDQRQAFDRWYVEQTKKQPQSSLPTKELFQENRFEPVHAGAAMTYPNLRNELSTNSSRSRIRTSFDPEHEIPRLHRWFQENQHPTREQLIHYLNELNTLESRRGRKPLELINITHWFKNARAAQRRALSRGAENLGDYRNFEMDESIDERLSPCSADQVPVLPNSNAVYVVSNPLHHTHGRKPEGESGGSSEQVPVLPNSNAVYVVSNPLHHSPVHKPENEKPDSPVVAIFPQEPQDEGDNNDAPSDMEAEDLSKQDKTLDNNDNDANNANANKENDASAARGRAGSTESQSSESSRSGMEMHVTSEKIKHNGNRAAVKCERLEEGYDFDRSSPDISSAVLSNRASLPQPPPAHQAAPLHITPIRPPVNLHYMHPAAAQALYGLEGSPLLANHAFEKLSSSAEDHRKKRSRVFIDPLSEIPKLERWFIEDTHPSSYMIEKYTEELNRSEYRQRFPKLEPKNVQLWFKNHRAKVKRSRLEYSSSDPSSYVHDVGTPESGSQRMEDGSAKLKRPRIDSPTSGKSESLQRSELTDQMHEMMNMHSTPIHQAAASPSCPPISSRSLHQSAASSSGPPVPSH